MLALKPLLFLLLAGLGAFAKTTYPTTFNPTTYTTTRRPTYPTTTTYTTTERTTRRTTYPTTTRPPYTTPTTTRRPYTTPTTTKRPYTTRTSTRHPNTTWPVTTATQPPIRCGEPLQYLNFSTHYAYVESPNYPQNYDNHEHCEWEFMSPNGTQIMIEFIDFEVSMLYERPRCKKI